MKRCLLLTLCLCAFALAQAQTFNYSGLEIKQEKVKKKSVYEWEQFVMVNYAPGFLNRNGSDYKMHSFGLTYGRVKLFGFYVNAMISTGFHYGYNYEAYSYYGSIYYEGKDIVPFYTGKNSSNRISFTAGGIVRMVIPLYFYAGIGYGYQSYTKQISSGEWVFMDDYSAKHGMNWDMGLQGNIKGFTISVGYSVMTDYDYRNLHEVKIGLGYTFKVN